MSYTYRKVKASAMMHGYPDLRRHSVLLSASLPSDRMWAPNVSRRSWGLAVMMHGGSAKDICVVALVVVRLVNFERCISVSSVPGPVALSKEEHWYMHTLSTVVHMCVHMAIDGSRLIPPRVGIKP